MFNRLGRQEMHQTTNAARLTAQPSRISVDSLPVVSSRSYRKLNFIQSFSRQRKRIIVRLCTLCTIQNAEEWNTEQVTRLVARKKLEEQGCNRSRALYVRSVDAGDVVAVAAAAAGVDAAGVAALAGARCRSASDPEPPAYSCIRRAWEGRA